LFVKVGGFIVKVVGLNDKTGSLRVKYDDFIVKMTKILF